MSKKTLFIIILVCTIIGVVLASKYVKGFDEGVNNIVIQPIAAGAAGIAATVASHPIMQAYGYPIMFICGILFTAGFALILWPKYTQRRAAKKTDTPLQDKIASAPTKIPQSTSAPKQVTVKQPPPTQETEPTKEAAEVTPPE